MYGDSCSRKIGKRRRELPPMKPLYNESENVEDEESSCVGEESENVVSMPTFATRHQSIALVLMMILSLSAQGCESFVSTSRTPGSRCCTPSLPNGIFLRVVETEAPAVSTEERSIGFHPPIPDHSIVCEQEPSEEREPADSNNENEGEVESTETTAEDCDYNDSEGDAEESAKQARLNAASRAAALLGNRKSRVKQNTNAKGTSVGARRMGAASKARKGAGVMTRLTDAVRRGASASTGQKNKDDSDSNDKLSAKLTQSVIHNAVGEMLQTCQPHPNMGVPQEASAPVLDLTEIQTTPPPGTILVDSPEGGRGWKASDRVSVRVATQSDDLDIANLRLSVFSNFSPDMRQSFCSRSCHVLSMRRNQGATCIVATVPRYGSILSDKKEIVLGTAECSIHEFFGTRLGSRRQQNSILYITEVAVSPTARRKGIGAKIMQSIDKLASIRGVETLYLHVEVTNEQALSLYEKAGFEKLTKEDRMYSEFTRSLGLHDGAMKGRCHYLMYKDVQQPTWISSDTGVSQRGTLGIELSA